MGRRRGRKTDENMDVCLSVCPTVPLSVSDSAGANIPPGASHLLTLSPPLSPSVLPSSLIYLFLYFYLWEQDSEEEELRNRAGRVTQAWRREEVYS